MSDEAVQLVSAVYLLIFSASLFVSAVSMVSRLVRYLRAGERVPELLPRDLLLVAGLLVPFLGILVFRTIGAGPELTRHPLWVIGSGALACIGAIAFATWELFLIERDRNGGSGS